MSPLPEPEPTRPGDIVYLAELSMPPTEIADRCARTVEALTVEIQLSEQERHGGALSSVRSRVNRQAW